MALTIEFPEGFVWVFPLFWGHILIPIHAMGTIRMNKNMKMSEKLGTDNCDNTHYSGKETSFGHLFHRGVF